MEMPTVGTWFLVIGLYVVLPLLTWPASQRVLMRLAGRLNGWSTARLVPTEQYDPEQSDLWLWEKRNRLCADLRRIEDLLATDTWMSATRQLANRLAYDQLVADLRDTPEVFPALGTIPSAAARDESAGRLGSAGYIGAAYPAQKPDVEILEIGRRPRGG